MSEIHADRWGVPVRAFDGGAVGLLDQAIEDLVALAGDPVGGAEAAIAADGELALARIFRAYLSLYATTADGAAEAGQLLEPLGPADAKLAEGPRSEREAHHLAAARAWADGDWHAATRALDRALLANPRDLLALKIAQDLSFFLGDRRELRDVVARVLPAWPPTDPAWGFVQGMYAFGLEENGDYRGAEDAARQALARHPRDVWAVHALAHVFEMEGRLTPGVSFLTSSAPDWRDSYFAVHNWWHLGLYLLELGRTDDALALYDERVRAARSTEWLDVVDAAALLWRLDLYGTDVTARAAALAADIRDLVSTPTYIFNDWHAVMAFGLAGDHARAAQVVAANQDLAAPTNRRAAERAGRGLLTAFSAFAAGEPHTAVDLLLGLRSEAHAVGGSHAQRDIIDLTLIAAAARSGQAGLARALTTERVARKPPAEPSARALLAANGGDEVWLTW
ncbi:tetratricopeptide repeat protein [Pseudofrankia sp. DC12]|uniref:tetratricopeptide repeat protein n=1 Tax=Pseudofrankia sp. DC12 TaxID=683315 RepID=UPI0005F7CE9F|nr:tetratricopeptide repeat protein [Pseudofrankia sp. DC12]